MKPLKQGRRAARTLALTQCEFDTEFGDFANDIAPYVERLRGRDKRFACLLSLRLFTKFVASKIEDDPTMNLLRSICRPDNSSLKSELMDSLLAFYAHLVSSNLYTAKHSFLVAKEAARVMRWLGREHPHRYPTLGRIVWRKSNRKDSRKNLSVGVLVRPLELAEIKAHFCCQLAVDVEGYQVMYGPRSIRGFRKVLAWLINGYDGCGRSVLATLRSAGRTPCDVAAIKDLLDQWDRATTASKSYSPKTVAGEKHSAARVFEYLGTLEGRNYPHFLKSYVKSRYTRVDSESVADIDFVETRGLVGAARIRKSLEVISQAAFHVLRKEVEVFEALGPARTLEFSAEISQSRRSALEVIAVVLQAELHSLQQTGYSQFSTSGVRTNTAEVELALHRLFDPLIWYQAGIPEGTLPTKFDLHLVRNLLCKGVGAGRAACLAAKIIIACDKGWNRQPIESIPPEIFAFRIFDDYGICSASFLQVFKNRAGHDVLALIEHGKIESPGRKEKIIAAWEGAEGDAKWLEQDERCLLKATDPSFVALELLRPLVEALNICSADPEVGKVFFKHISWSHGVSTNDSDVRASFKGGILGTAGVTFPAIRKAVLRLHLKEIGSIAGVRPFAGHVAQQVLVKSYFNCPDTRRELWESTRFFQNAVQALILDQIGASWKLNVSDEQHDWFLRLAHASGIASAVGFGVSIPISGPQTFRFEPTPDGIRGLVSLHASLVLKRRLMPRLWWAMTGIPLLGFVIAVRRKLKEAGFAVSLRQETRKFMGDLRSGRAVLTRLEPGVWMRHV